MKSNIYITAILSLAALLWSSCENSPKEPEAEEAKMAEEMHGPAQAHLSIGQFEALGIEMGALPQRIMANTVKASGTLEVPPQNEATATAIIGANIASIEVIEGEEVGKGQVLAYLSHPNITKLQQSYVAAHHEAKYLEQEYSRQERLYNKEVGAGKVFQKTASDYKIAQSSVKSLAAQLRQFSIDPKRVLQGDFYDQVPVISPIPGAITMVSVQTGQYVAPATGLFEIVNTHHVHVDFMVFEKDVHKVEEGQRIRLLVESLPGTELHAEIYSVGKKFEQEPKAVHVHAELQNKSSKLIPGMYVRGEILTDSLTSSALPESALVREGNDYIAFIGEKQSGPQGEEWHFTPIRMLAGIQQAGWVGVKPLDSIPKNAQFALSQAYYLMSELKKGEGGGHHH